MTFTCPKSSLTAVMYERHTMEMCFRMIWKDNMIFDIFGIEVIAFETITVHLEKNAPD